MKHEKTNYTFTGFNDRFQVATTASMFAPSVTTVVDTHNDSASTYAGPSVVGQVVNAAGTVAGGYLLGQGIGRSGTKVTQNGGSASSGSVSGSLSNATAKGGNAFSSSRSESELNNRTNIDVDVSNSVKSGSSHHD